MDFEEYFKNLQEMREIKEISLFINDECNLSCTYCYVQKLKKGKLVSNSEWINFLADAKDANIISIVGKEPFMTPEKTLDLLGRLNEKRFSHIKKGVVTNATLITPSIAKQLAEISNLYIDISIDGIPDVHNSPLARGVGNMERSMRGLFYLQEAGIKDIFVSHMLSSASMQTFSEFMDFCAEKGLKKIVIFPFINSISGVETVNKKDHCLFIEKIMSPNYLKSHNLVMVIKTDYLVSEICLEVIKQFIDVEELEEDANGVLYRKKVVNGNTLYINFLPFPMEFCTALRINYNGNVIFCGEMVSEDVVGNISEGFQAIQDKILTSKKVKEFYLEKFLYVKKIL